MKTLKYTSANKAIDVEYLTDLIGSNEELTIYQVTQFVDEVKQVGLNGTAVVFGMPDVIDEFTLTEMKAVATDKNLTLQVIEQGQSTVTLNTLTALAWVTAALDAGTINVAYSMELEAEGGNEPYIFTTESTLPAGVTLSEAGVLSGTPTESGTFTLTITVTDQFGVSADLEDVDLVIAAA